MYHTENELMHFDFREAVVDEITLQGGVLSVFLENVKILPENSCNRDIRLMRTNDLVLTVRQASLVTAVKEGYKRYNADGVLQECIPDVTVAAAEYPKLLTQLAGAEVYALTESAKESTRQYVFSLDASEHSYELTFTGTTAITEWERFLNL